jgi:hypothetical protein
MEDSPFAPTEALPVVWADGVGASICWMSMKALAAAMMSTIIPIVRVVRFMSVYKG